MVDWLCDRLPSLLGGDTVLRVRRIVAGKSRVRSG